MTAYRYNNTSVPVVLVSGVNDTDDTLTVGSTGTYPEAPFLLGVDRGTGSEEVMLCTAKTPTTFTVTRGFDGTTGVAHNIGAIVEHSSAAISHRRGSVAQVTTAERDALAGVDLWNGRTVWNTDTSKLQYYTGSVWANVGPRTGAIEMFGGASAPPGALLCQGQAVSQTTYADLFAVIGVTFGDPGGGNFNLPDLRQRFPIGKAGSGVASTLGETGGAIDHTHSQPTHTHTGPSHTHSQPTHTHGNSSTGSGGSHSHTMGNTGQVSFILPYNHNHDGGGGVVITNQMTSGSHWGLWRRNDIEHDHTTPNTSNTGSHSHNVGTSDAGGGDTTGSAGTGSTSADGADTTGSANPPYIALNFIIYT